MPALYTNQATSTLASGIASNANQLSVQTNHGTRFPAAGTNNEYFFATLDNGAGTVEIIKVTARSGDTFTIERAQDGTTASGFSAGTTVELRITRALLDAVKNEATPTPISLTTTVTAVASFTAQGIPSWCTEINLATVNATKTSNSSYPLIRLGTSGGLDANFSYHQLLLSGAGGVPAYAYNYTESAFLPNFNPNITTNTAFKLYLSLRLIDKSSNRWMISGGGSSNISSQWGAGLFGYKELSGALSQFQILMGAGTFSGNLTLSYR
jgi:hypothetical protein